MYSALDSAQTVEGEMFLLETIASLNTQMGDDPAAVDCLQKLASLRPNDMYTLCCLIKAYAKFDSKKAEQLSAQVFPQESTSSVDIDELERSDLILYGERYRQKKETKAETTQEEVSLYVKL